MLRDTLPVAVALGLACGIAGCEGAVSSPGGGDGPNGPMRPDDLSPCRTPNFEIYSGLHASCVGCHDATDNRPFFAEFEWFERQIVYSSVDPLPGEQVFVIPGDPSGSELVKLLEGTGGGLGQMPPGAQSYADLAAAGQADIGMDEVRNWIQNLQICELPEPDPIVVARRMPADMIRTELQRQLDLTDAEIDSSGRALGSPDDSPQRVGNQRRAGAHDAWQDLGGAHILDGRRNSTEVSEPLLQILVPTSQAWCSISVRNKDILFRDATRDSQSATDEAAIKANIRYLFLHMLGEVASDADVNAMYDSVFVPTETSEDSPTAWTAVCATLVRDPLWLTY